MYPSMAVLGCTTQWYASFQLRRCSCVIVTVSLMLCQLRHWYCANCIVDIVPTLSVLLLLCRGRSSAPSDSAVPEGARAHEVSAATVQSAVQKQNGQRHGCADVQRSPPKLSPYCRQNGGGRLAGGSRDMPEDCIDCLLMALLTMSRNTGCAKLHRGMMIVFGAGLGPA